MARNLEGRRVLVVEDEAYIAFDLKSLLSDRGAVVLGPAPNLAAAGALLDDNDTDAAIIDMNLNGEWSYPLADRLKASSVPYMFITGYDDWSLPEAYRGTPRLSKPFSDTEVARLVEQLCAGEKP